MYLCVCMHDVCMYVCMYVRMYVDMYVCMHAYVYIYTCYILYTGTQTHILRILRLYWS